MRTKQAVIVAALAVSSAAFAAVTPEEAAKLGGPELTETGAVRAGNADGSIPAYSGKMPPSAKAPESAGKFRWGDPYANEKPLYVVDAKNVDKYADKLSDGQKVLLKRFPAYRIEVFATKRDIVLPEGVRNNTKKCATTAQLVGGGDGLTGASACIPFPLPKSGYEVLWNASLYPGAPMPYELVEMTGWLVNSAGGISMVSRSRMYWEQEYWNPEVAEPKYSRKLVNEHRLPAAKAGSKEMMWAPLRKDLESPRAWLYLPGQRRVRLAPEFTYDNVATNYGGLLVYEEVNGLFDGKMDRFDFSKFELKEIIVPFNTQKSHFQPADKMSEQNHPDPSLIRWELRRVYVVDAPRKAEARHAYKRKVFYIDQDSFAIVAYDAFDDAGNIHRTGIALPWVRPEVPSVVQSASVMWDLNRNVWGYIGHMHDGGVFPNDKLPATFMTPDALAGGGVR